ncbi:MAG: zinc ribbon domain-containing protein [bacterium]
MPVYEYNCDDCGRRFDLVASLAEKEAGLAPECPACGSRNCRQVFGRVNIVTSTKSEAFDDDFGGDGDSGDTPGGEFDDDSLNDDAGLDDLD